MGAHAVMNSGVTVYSQCSPPCTEKKPFSENSQSVAKTTPRLSDEIDANSSKEIGVVQFCAFWQRRTVLQAMCCATIPNLPTSPFEMSMSAGVTAFVATTPVEEPESFICVPFVESVSRFPPLVSTAGAPTR